MIMTRNDYKIANYGLGPLRRYQQIDLINNKSFLQRKSLYNLKKNNHGQTDNNNEINLYRYKMKLR